MTNGTIARRYARALLATVGDSMERAHADLMTIADSIAATPEAKAFADPTLPREAKAAFVDKLIEQAAPHPMVANFLRLLAQRDRLEALPEIATVFDEMVNDRLGRVRAKVQSAVALSESEQGKLREALSRATKREVELESVVDEKLLGGMVARVGSTIFDGSVRSQLASLRNELLGRA